MNAGLGNCMRSAAGLLMLMSASQMALAHASEGASSHQNQAVRKEVLPQIRPAPSFQLTDQAGRTFSSETVQGKVVAINFVFTRCTDVCPLATAKMVQLQEALGPRFGEDVHFVSVTVDPDHDTPQILAQYAKALGCDPDGWRFLTGSKDEIRNVARSYGVVHRRHTESDVEHLLVTTLIDRSGTIRVQYLGERFDPREMLTDLRALLNEGQVH